MFVPSEKRAIKGDPDAADTLHLLGVNDDAECRLRQLHAMLGNSNSPCQGWAKRPAQLLCMPACMITE